MNGTAADESSLTDTAKLEQPQAPEARMAFAADHQVVVDRDAERLRRRLDLARHLDVVAAGPGIATWMIVHEGSMRHITLIFKEVRQHR